MPWKRTCRKRRVKKKSSEQKRRPDRTTGGLREPPAGEKWSAITALRVIPIIRDPQQPARKRTLCAAVRSSVYGGKPSWQPTVDQFYIRESWLSGCVVQSKVNLAYGIAL